MMTEDDLDEIEARHARATGGPWISIVEGRDQLSGSSFIQTARDEDLYVIGGTVDDQDFIAGAHEDIPRLLTEVRRLKAELSLSRAST